MAQPPKGRGKPPKRKGSPQSKRSKNSGPSQRSGPPRTKRDGGGRNFKKKSSLPSEKGRRRGPPPIKSLREHGDKKYSSTLAKSLAFSGRVERATHGFHSYPAGMHPDAARDIIEICPGAVHDPFCGGGTVLVEALLAGRQTSGSDLSPIARLITTARCSGPQLATPLRSASRAIAALAQQRIDVDIPEELVQWYEPHVAQELGRIRNAISKYDPEVQPLLRAVFSAIAVKASYRESDTSNRRIPYHRPPGTTAILFHKKARELGRALDTMPEERSLRLKIADARKAAAPEEVGLVLTSPPYPGVYDYLPLQQLRYAWLNLDADKGKSAEIGSRRTFRSRGRGDALRLWRKDTSSWIQRQSQKIIPNGFMVIFVGDGLVGGRPVDSLMPTTEAMESSGMTVVARVSAGREDHARGALRTEHVIMAQKAQPSEK